MASNGLIRPVLLWPRLRLCLTLSTHALWRGCLFRLHSAWWWCVQLTDLRRWTRMWKPKKNSFDFTTFIHEDLLAEQETKKKDKRIYSHEKKNKAAWHYLFIGTIKVGGVQRHPIGDAKCVIEILRGGQKRKLGRGQNLPFCFKVKISALNRLNSQTVCFDVYV